MPAPTRVLAIGDIHGSVAALDALLAAVAPAADDRVVTLGDYVDGGIDSAGVIERLIRLSTTCELIPLRGNHEEMMMDARRGPQLLELWKRLGGDATLISYAPDEDAPGLNRVPAHHWHFNKHLFPRVAPGKLGALGNCADVREARDGGHFCHWQGRKRENPRVH